jgi:hypothetical protein
LSGRFLVEAHREGVQGACRLPALRRKLCCAGHRSRYRLRKQFLLRGRATVGGEWALVSINHNPLKLAAA